MADPACGTGGFFLANYEYLNAHYKLDKSQKQVLKHKTFAGWEIVPATVRLCLMNMFLHNIGEMDGKPPVTRQDFWTSTSNKQLNFIQHIKSMLKIDGQAAVV